MAHSGHIARPKRGQQGNFWKTAVEALQARDLPADVWASRGGHWLGRKPGGRAAEEAGLISTLAEIGCPGRR